MRGIAGLDCPPALNGRCLSNGLRTRERDRGKKEHNRNFIDFDYHSQNNWAVKEDRSNSRLYRLDLAERPLAQAGPVVSEAVGLRPEAHFQGARHPVGRGVRLSIRSGFDLSAYELEVEGQPSVSGTTQPCLAVVVLLSGNGEGRITEDTGDLPPVPYRAGNLYVSLARRPTTGTARAWASDPFRLVELRLSLDFLAATGALAAFDAAGRMHPLHHVSSQSFWLGIARAPRAILDNAEALFYEALSGSGADLRIEARALGLFDAVNHLMRADTEKRPADGFTARDAARLDQLRTAMQRDLAYPWSIAELARRAGLNVKRLKQDYRVRFGRTINADLQAMRVEEGRALLLQGSTVTDVSLAVGYANPSHFARLFRRHYGIPPRLAR